MEKCEHDVFATKVQRPIYFELHENPLNASKTYHLNYYIYYYYYHYYYYYYYYYY